MLEPSHALAPTRGETRFCLALFIGCLAFHFWAVGIGWGHKSLFGVEWRQAQTALSTYFIKAENNFSLAYPTPVLGKPWSIPMEFPLYQWTVVVVGKLTGLGLTKAGRAVSIACFYLCLPAIFLLLARWRVARAHRWLVLAVVLTCPLYIFYARAFLIETMALMFALWFWVAYERGVAGRNLGWLALAIGAGAGAGLVKVTTLMLYVLPMIFWSIRRLWAKRADGGWRTELAWMVGATLVPMLATGWWIHFADATKALNPLAHFLRSAEVRDFTLGTAATLFSWEYWTLKGRIMVEDLTWLPAVGACACLAVAVRLYRGREILLNSSLFIAALIIFPVLYAFHPYYYVANTMFLLLAMGLVVVSLAEAKHSRWLVAGLVLLITGGQAGRYLDYYYPVQRDAGEEGSGLTQALRALTRANEYIIIVGQDWNSMIPYYAQRRALMLRNGETEPVRLDPALAAMRGEKAGALLVAGPWENQPALLQRIGALGLETKPLLVWRDTAIFLPVDRRVELLGHLELQGYHDVNLAPGVEFRSEKLAGAWVKVANIYPRNRHLFNAMQPMPVRFWSTFGLALDGSRGRPAFGAHPVTRLVFNLPSGKHRLRTVVELPLASYTADTGSNQRTDGVEITLSALGVGETSVLYTRLLDPLNRQSDRGPQVLSIDFSLMKAGEVELFFGPGPQGRDTRDWITVGPLVID